MGTATGAVPGYLIKLDTLKVGGVTLQGVDAVVWYGPRFGPPPPGMSARNRLNMKREGDTMTPTRRY